MSTNSTPAESTAAGTEKPSKQISMKVIAFIATLGGLLFGFDTGVIAGALPFMELPVDEGGLGLTPLTEGLVTSSLLIGAAFGALYGGRLSDRYGRRHNIIMLAVVFLIGALGCALAPNLAVLLPFRVVLGLAVGGASATVPVYLAEVAPKEYRGTLVAVDQLMIVTGQMLAYISNALWANFYGEGDAWRWMLGIASIPAIALWIGMHFMPETARWFASKGEMVKARTSLQQTRPHGHIDAELDEITALVREEEETVQYRFRDLAVPWVRRIMVIGIGIALLQQLTGVNTIMYYAPTILTETGLGTNTALTATIANGVISVIGSAVGLFLVTRIRRRKLLMTGQAIIVVALAGIALSFLWVTEPGSPESLTRSYLVLGFMLLFLLGQQGAVSPVTWVQLSEIFPLKLRGLGMGSAIFCLWVVNALISFSFPLLVAGIGAAWTFALFVLINVGTLTFSFLMVPETKHMTLEQIEEFFQHEYSGRARAH